MSPTSLIRKPRGGHDSTLNETPSSARRHSTIPRPIRIWGHGQSARHSTIAGPHTLELKTRSQKHGLFAILVTRGEALHAVARHRGEGWAALISRLRTPMADGPRVISALKPLLGRDDCPERDTVAIRSTVKENNNGGACSRDKVLLRREKKGTT